MDEKLKAETLKWLTDLHGATAKAGGFVLDQAPEVAREVILLGRVWHSVAFLMSLASVIAIAGAVIRYRKALREGWDDAEPLATVCCITSPILSAVFLILTLVEFSSAATAWFAPRLYLLQELAGLIKSAS